MRRCSTPVHFQLAWRRAGCSCLYPLPLHFQNTHSSDILPYCSLRSSKYALFQVLLYSVCRPINPFCNLSVSNIFLLVATSECASEFAVFVFRPLRWSSKPFLNTCTVGTTHMVSTCTSMLNRHWRPGSPKSSIRLRTIQNTSFHTFAHKQVRTTLPLLHVLSRLQTELHGNKTRIRPGRA